MSNKLIDPLAQTFYVDNPKGIFATSVDVYFYDGDRNLPVTVELRPTINGTPSSTDIYPFSSVTLEPDKVIISPDASASTRFTFKSPVFLKGETFHSLVIIANSKEYSVWIARLGEPDVTKINDDNSKQVFVSSNPNSGAFFRSQNGSTWSPSEREDLKFVLNRAEFKENSGNVNFYNPELDTGNDQISILDNDAFEMESRQEKLVLSTGLNEVGLATGMTITQQNSDGTGNYVGNAGAASSLTVFNAGIGLTPSSGGLTYFDVPLTKVTGAGKDATCNLTVQNGVAVGATIVNGGTGYQVGDLVTANNIGDGLGRNLRLTIGELGSINQIIVDDIQGTFNTGAGSTLTYSNTSGITTQINAASGGLLVNDSTVVHDGLHIKVNHPNHGMYAPENLVKIDDVDPDHPSVDATADIAEDSTAPIPIDNLLLDENGISIFANFENVGVSSTNPGYVQIEEEIIAYTGIDGLNLTGITREVDNTLGTSYEKGVDIVKYELNGISLRRINKTHELQDATVDNAIDLDHYHIRIDPEESGVDRSSNPAGYPDLFFKETKSSGGDDITATQNIQYEIIDPEIKTVELAGTEIEVNLRSVSGRSVGGNQESFIDQGFETISTEEETYLSSPRLICSKVNEDELLDDDDGIEGNKSLNLSVNLSTTTRTLSPMIDLDRCSVVLIGNRMNKPITDYANDERTADLENDPHAFVYATRPISLENPATSIDVYVTAYVNKKSDLRAFYAISDDNKEKMIYYPFPGFSNLDERGEVEDISKSDGQPDTKLAKTDSVGFKSDELEFQELKFSINKLPSFRTFGIKLCASSEDSTYPVRLKDLRVIALA
tara:strand:- start:443 stop:2947 length:2505 start_codon:yes stop_codon:yes gene_type:complete